MPSLPTEVWEMIALDLCGNDKVRFLLVVPSQWKEGDHYLRVQALQDCLCMQVNLALCSKAMLPLLYKGSVMVRLDKPKGERPLTQFTRCLSQQPAGISHLNLYTDGSVRGTRKLIDLRCAHTMQTCLHGAGHCMSMPLLCQCQTHKMGHDISICCLLTQSADQTAPPVPGRSCFLPAGAAASCYAAAKSHHFGQPPGGQRRWLPERELECPEAAVS